MARAIRPLQIRGGLAVVQRRERAALRRVALAHHLRQTHRAQAAAHGGEPPAGLHRGQLAGVADRDHLRARPLRCLQQLRARASRGHPRLIKDHHAPLGQLLAELLEFGQQPVKRARRDPRLLGQLARGAACWRDTDHLYAGRFVYLAQYARGIGLPRPRQRFDHAHPVAAAHHRSHGVGLLRG
jgi:hypothetical protein